MKELIRAILKEEVKERNYDNIIKLAKSYIESMNLNGFCGVKLAKGENIVGVIFTQGFISDSTIKNLEDVLEKIFHVNFMLIQVWRGSCKEFDYLLDSVPLKESTSSSQLLNLINRKGVLNAAQVVGGVERLKLMFKDNPAVLEKIDQLRGLIRITPHGNSAFILPFKIIGSKLNERSTSEWAIIDVLYDESLLTKEENDLFKSYIITSDYEGTINVIRMNNEDIRNKTYVEIEQINGVDVSNINFVEYNPIDLEIKLYPKLKQIFVDDANKLMDNIKKYLIELLKKTDSLNGYVCDVNVELDNESIVTEIFIDKDQYDSLNYDYNIYQIRTKIADKLRKHFGLSSSHLYSYIEKCD